MLREQFTDEVIQKLKDRTTKRAKLVDGTVVRVFLSEGGSLCQFRGKSTRRGFIMDIGNVAELLEGKPAAEIDIDKRTYKQVAKFLKQAKKAKFKNDFINDCLALPDTFEKWVADGKKSAYEYHITTGCSVTGDLISIETIAKHMPDYCREGFLNAIKEHFNYSTSRFPFLGYEASIQLKKEENGEFRGWLSKEYKDCGNGYYFLLINEDYFIGYDKD